MTRMLGAVFATLAVLVAGTLWLRSAIEERAEAKTARVRTEDLGEAALSAGRDAAEAAVDWIVEYIPPTPPGAEPVDAPRPRAPAPRAKRAAPARPEEPVVVQPLRREPPAPRASEIELADVPDRRSMRFVESGAPRPPERAAPAAAEVEVAALPARGANPSDAGAKRGALIRRLLDVYDRMRDE